MKFRLINLFLFLFILINFSGCQVFQDIFAAGAWIGLIGALILIGVIYLIVRAVKGR